MLCDLLSIYVHRYWPRVLLKVVRSHLDIIEPKLRLVGRREKCDAEDNKPDVCEGWFLGSAAEVQFFPARCV